MIEVACGLVILIAVVYWKGRNKSSQVVYTNLPKQPNIENAFYKKQKPPQPGLCIVYFREDQLHKYQDLMREVKCSDQTPDYKNYLITKESDIRNKQLFRLSFVFVPFSERDIIIEESGMGVGGMIKETIKYLNDNGVNKKVIYVRDRRSERLPPDRLFCKDLEDTVSKDEFKSLIKDGEFLSIFDRFHEHQKDLLKFAIRDECPNQYNNG